MPVDVVTGDRDLFQLVDDDARRPGALHRPRRRPSSSSSPTRVVVREVRRAARASTRTSRCMRGDASDGLPGRRRASARRRPPACCSSTATSTASWRPPRTPRDDGAGARAKMIAAADYLEVAPTVVAGGARPRPPAGTTPRAAARRARLELAAHARSPGASAARSTGSIAALGQNRRVD